MRYDSDKRLTKFWKDAYEEANDKNLNTKNIILPLARIKRLMKIEEGVRMIASEVPVIFSMVTEKFIEDLTLRAWNNVEDNKRRILQTNDISVAVKSSEMFDFLVYIVPRTETTIFDKIQSDRIYNPIVLGKALTGLQSNMDVNGYKTRTREYTDE